MLPKECKTTLTIYKSPTSLCLLNKNPNNGFGLLKGEHLPASLSDLSISVISRSQMIFSFCKHTDNIHDNSNYTECKQLNCVYI